MARVETSANAVADASVAAVVAATAIPAPAAATATTAATTTGPKTPTLRLFFVRHGETEANVQRIVVGQSDSPLTELGIAQTKALGQSPYWNLYTVDSACQKFTSGGTATSTAAPPPPLHILPFWRIYSSDLLRTRRTTHLLLQSLAAAHRQRRQQKHSATATADDNVTIASTASAPVDDPHCSGDDHESGKVDDDETVVNVHTPTVRYDARLREIAKGVRQGYPKHWTYEQALEAYHQDNTANLDTSSSDTTSFTLTEESSEDGWRRALDWLQELVYNVAAAAANADVNAASAGGTTTLPVPGVVAVPHHDECDAVAAATASAPLAAANISTIYPVLVVAHAGLLRIIYQRLLGWDRLALHKDAIINAKDERERLTVPNTSLTILDLHLSEQKQLLLEQQQQQQQQQPGAHAEHQSSGAMLPLLVDKIDVVLLTSTDHITSPI